MSTDMSKYVKEFSIDFSNFIDFLGEVEVTPEIEKMQKSMNKINGEKIAKYIYSKTDEKKSKIRTRDEEIFIEKYVCIPSIDLSYFFNKMDDDKKNVFWDKFTRLQVFSTIIVKGIKPELNESIEVKGGQIMSINEMIAKESEEFEEKYKSFSLNDILSNALNVDDFADKINNITDDDVGKITETVSSIFGTDMNDDTKEVIGEMIKGVSKEVKNIDFKNGDLMDNVQQLATNISKQYMEDESKHEDIAKLAGATEGFMDKISNEGVNDNLINEVMKQMGMNNKNINMNEVNQMMKEMGLTEEQIMNPSRKMKRKMNKVNKKK